MADTKLDWWLMATPEPIENIYSGVVSLRYLRLVIFLGKLNNVELWGADIGNAYREAFTDEKLYIVAGPEFQELEGYILIFLKALYGLKSSGKRWAEVIHGILRDMKFLLTEKIQSGTTSSQKSHNVDTRLSSGFLVSFASGVVEWIAG